MVGSHRLVLISLCVSDSFKDVDEQLDAERVAGALHHKADEMQEAASAIEHDDERRRLLEQAQELRKLAKATDKVLL